MDKSAIVVAIAVAALALSVASFQIALYSVSEGRTYTTTVTKTVDRDGALGITIVESVGRCGQVESPSLKVVGIEKKGDGLIVTLVYRESVPNPCYRHHVIESILTLSHPPTLYITLGLEATSEICIQCLGFVETKLQTDILPAGTKIVVNGLSITV